MCCGHEQSGMGASARRSTHTQIQAFFTCMHRRMTPDTVPLPLCPATSWPCSVDCGKPTGVSCCCLLLPLKVGSPRADPNEYQSQVLRSISMSLQPTQLLLPTVSSASVSVNTNRTVARLYSPPISLPCHLIWRSRTLGDLLLLPSDTV